MKIRMTDDLLGYVRREYVGEVIGFRFDVDDMVIFKVIWYGKPGIDEVRADLVESV